MLNRLAILAILMVCPWGMSGQPDRGAHPNPGPTEQDQPALHSTKVDQSILSNDNKRGGAGNNPQSGNAPVEKTHWWARSEWWLVLIAGLTGGVIAWQSWETRKAAQGARKSAEASIAQIEFMKNKERAQLRMELLAPDFLYKKEIDGYEVGLTVFNDGATRAYVLEGSIVAYVSDQQREMASWTAIGLPRNFLPESGPFKNQTTIRAVDCVFDHETDSRKIGLARDNKLTLFVNGRIRYRDIFQDEWILEIDRCWVAAVGSWCPVGSGRHDTHRRIDKSYRDRRPCPN